MGLSSEAAGARPKVRVSVHHPHRGDTGSWAAATNRSSRLEGIHHAPFLLPAPAGELICSYELECLPLPASAVAPWLGFTG